MAIRFDAAADRLLRTTSPPSYNSAYTIMGWVYFTSLTAGNYVKIFTQNDNSITNYDEVAVADVAPYEFLCASVISSSYSEIAATTIPTTSTWYHLALVRASSSSLLLYVNGIQEVNNTLSISGRTANTRMEIGGGLSSNINPLDGRVAAIKIYNTNLTAAEIQNEMRYYTPQRTTNLHIWTPGVETTAANADNDYSGNGNNWTAGGTLTIEDGPPITWGPSTQQMMFIPAGGVSVTVNPAVQTGAFSTATISFVTDQVLAQNPQSLTFSIPSVTLSTEQILSLGVQSGTFSVVSPTVSIDTIIAPSAQTATLSTAAISFVTDQILALAAQSATFSLPAITVISGGDVVVTQADAQLLQMLLGSPNIVTDAILDISTKTLVLTLNPPDVSTPVPTTATTSKIYLFIGIR